MAGWLPGPLSHCHHRLRGNRGRATLTLFPRAQDGTFVARTGCRESQSFGTAGLVLRDREWASSHCPGAAL